MNPRELLHVYELRCGAEAQWEIRAVAWAMLACSKLVAPSIFSKIAHKASNAYLEEKEEELGRILSKLRPHFEKAIPGKNMEIPLATLNLGLDVQAFVYKR
jgi:thymidylate synthase (FAD)